MLDARLRAGNVGTADGALDVIRDVAMVWIYPGSPSAALLVGLEARDIDYVSRLRANAALDRMAEPLMKRPPGRRPAEPCMWIYELRYQADSWEKPRRVVRVVKEREGDLLLDRFFLAPALSSTNRAKSHLRGRAPKFRTPAIDAFTCNEVCLLIACLAYQIMHIARRAMEKATGTGWSLRRLRERMLRVGARLAVSARRMTLRSPPSRHPSGPRSGHGLSRFTGQTRRSRCSLTPRSVHNATGRGFRMRRSHQIKPRNPCRHCIGTKLNPS